MKLLLALGVTVLAASAQADTVVLQNGKTYTGKIKSTDNGVLVIRSEGIDWTLPLNQVSSQEQNEDGIEDASVLENPKAAPPPVSTSAKGGKKGKKGKAGIASLILYTEANCAFCEELKGTMRRNNNKVRFEVREITSTAARAELCTRARTFKAKCDKLPLVEYDGKLYEGADMVELANGKVNTLPY